MGVAKPQCTVLNSVSILLHAYCFPTAMSMTKPFDYETGAGRHSHKHINKAFPLLKPIYVYFIHRGQPRLFQDLPKVFVMSRE